MQPNFPSKNISLKLCLAYLLFGLSWIIFSDRILLLLVQDIERIQLLQTFKGGFFVCLSSLILYFLACYFLKKEAKLSNEIYHSQKRFKLFLDEAPYIAVQVLDEKGNISYWNASSENLYGYPASEVVGKKIASTILSKDQWEQEFDLIQDLLNDEDVPPYLENQYTHKDGKEFHVLTSYAIFKQPEGNIDILRWDLDLTTFEYAQKTQKKHELLLQTLGENIPLGVLFQIGKNSYGDPCFTYMSKGLSKTLGISRQELLADYKLMQNLIHEEDMNQYLQEFDYCINNLKGMDTEVRIICPDGSIKWICFILTPRLLEAESVIWDGFIQDITARKAAEIALLEAKEKAESANKAKDSFLAVMSHEMRTPLNPIIGLASMMKDNHCTEEQDKFLSLIIQSAETLLKQIESVLEFTRIDVYNTELHESPFYLAQFIHDTVDSLVDDSKGNKIFVEVDKDSPYVISDQTKIRQILSNIISNACKFTDNGVIHVRGICVETGHQMIKYRIEVSDTGPGISKEKQKHIFAPFTQVDNSFTRSHEGLGLGLAIADRLAKVLGGSLELKSEIGKGSLFSFNFSIKRVLSTLTAENSSDGITSEHLPRVLLAEDNLDNREVLCAYLSRIGCNITCVENGRDAINTAKHGDFDIILMDLSMPIVSGFEALHDIRKIPSRISKLPIIAVTAHASGESRRQSLLAGFDDYMVKPVSYLALKNMIEKWKGGSSQLQKYNNADVG